MIKPTFFLLLLACCTALTAQQIVEMEYFFNVDPGFGNGVSLPITSGENTNILAEIDVSSLDEGCHVLHFRCQDENGKWSFTHSKTFFRLPNPVELANLTKIEYAFTADFSDSETILVSATAIHETFAIDLDHLSLGFHTIFIRIIDEHSVKSLTQAKTIFKTHSPHLISDIVEIKYYFELDESDAVFLYPEANTTIEEQVEVSLVELDFGFHILYFQIKNAAGIWSMRFAKPIFKEIEEIAWNVTGVEWYFSGSDANENHIYWREFSDQQTEDAFDVSLLHLTQGNEYELHIAAVNDNGKRSLEQQFPFELNFTPQYVNISKSDEIVLLEWDEIIGATHYKIYSSDFPDANFLLDTSGTFTGTSWQTSISQGRKFYYVIAEKEERNFDKIRRNKKR
jgi:hypothetical protein